MKNALLILLLNSVFCSAQHKVVWSERHMGSSFHISVVHSDSAAANSAIKKAYQRISEIENQISSWIPNSQTDNINQNFGQIVTVDSNLYYLIERCKKMSVLSDGAFDISVRPLFELYTFDKKEHKTPSSEEVRNKLRLVNHKNILLYPEQRGISLSDSGMSIGFGAIGKGYAADEAIRVLKEEGIENALVNAGGDILCIGNDLNKDGWHIVIAHPQANRKVIADFVGKDIAVVTSGNYERYYTYQGEIFGHILDPSTGFPVTETRSVTVLAPTAELGDAFSTTISVLGKIKGIDLVEKIPGIEVIMVDKNNEIHSSSGIRTVIPNYENQ